MENTNVILEAQIELLEDQIDQLSEAIAVESWNKMDAEKVKEIIARSDEAMAAKGAKPITSESQLTDEEKGKLANKLSVGEWMKKFGGAAVGAAVGAGAAYGYGTASGNHAAKTGKTYGEEINEIGKTLKGKASSAFQSKKGQQLIKTLNKGQATAAGHGVFANDKNFKKDGSLKVNKNSLYTRNDDGDVVTVAQANKERKAAERKAKKDAEVRKSINLGKKF